jgi:hypothetical protein
VTLPQACAILDFLDCQEGLTLQDLAEFHPIEAIIAASPPAEIEAPSDCTDYPETVI